ncbi:MAG: putative ABC transporter permease, partial [Eubacterium sp.]
STIIISVLLIILVIDYIMVMFAGRKISKFENIADVLNQTSRNIGSTILLKTQKRIIKSFPELTKCIENGGTLKEAEAELQTADKGKRIFAKGLCFDKLVWIFFASALAGDIIETLYVFVVTGELMSRSSLLYGPFSVVWGLGGAIGTGLLYGFKDKNDRYIFISGFLIGGVYEYSCSVFTELVFGTRFWDYSDMPFNLNGRVNLLFCFFWGIMAILWIKILYPAVSSVIEKLPVVIGAVLTWSIIVFMVLDMLVSGLAIGRYVTRLSGDKPDNVIEEFLDNQYPDEFINMIYPNMKISPELRNDISLKRGSN